MTTPRLATAIRLPDNPFLRPLVDLLPGYRDALELAEHAEAALLDLPPVPPVPAELDPFTSGQITREWLDATTAHENAAAQYERDRQRIQHVKQRALGNASSVLSSKVNWLLRGLHDNLTALLAQVADVDRDLAGAATPDQAIGRGVTEQWKRLRDLADDYSTLRSAQDWIMLNLAPKSYWQTRRPVLGGPDHANLAWLRGLGDVHPSWRNPGIAQRINVDGTKDRVEPWPVDEYSPQMLLWLTRTPDAQPWVATLPQIDELFRQVRDDDGEPSQASQQQPARQTLNEPPRDYFDRVAPAIGTASTPPVDLDELATVGEPQ